MELQLLVIIYCTEWRSKVVVMQNPQNMPWTLRVKSSPSLVPLPDVHNLSSDQSSAEHFWHASGTQAWMASQEEVAIQPSCGQKTPPAGIENILSHRSGSPGKVLPQIVC